MKLFFIAASLLLMFGNVHGGELSAAQILADETIDNQPVFNDEDTYFNQLRNMFAQGTLPMAEETLGWWSGRCYENDSPNNPINMLLVFRTTDSRATDSNSYQMFAIHASNQPADHYDTLTNGIEQDTKRLIDGSHNGYDFTTREKNGSWHTQTSSRFATDLRKHQNYFVMQFSTSAGDEFIVFTSCYFFSKIYSY